MSVSRIDLSDTGTLKARLYALVVRELEAIDRASVVPHAGYRSVAVALCTATISLLLLRYFGSPAFYSETIGHSISVSGDPQLDAIAYWSFSCLVAYVGLPLLSLWLFGLGSPRELGLSTAGFWRHFPLYVAMFLPVFGGIVFVSHFEAFQAVYPFYKSHPLYVRNLIVFELLYALQFVSLEFFFRGYLLHVPKRRIGAAAIFVMIVPYCMIHFLKPFPEAASSIAGGIALGFLSLRTGSILGGCWIHIMVAWSMDLMSLYRQGKLEPLLAALG